MDEFDDDEYDDNEEQNEESEDEQNDENQQDDENDGQEDSEEELTEEEVAAADAAQDEFIKNSKENKKQEILRQFLLLKSKYIVSSNFWPFLSYNELKLCNQVKKISYPQYASFMRIVEMKKGSFIAKVNSILATIVPILPYLIIGYLVIVGVVYIFGTIMPYLAGDGNADGMASVLGTKGDCFYGVRAIYRDVEQSKTDLLNDYTDMLTYTISNFESSDVTLNITLPAEDYNFADFETNTGYKDAYNLVLKLARIVYSVDNSVSVDNAPANLDDLLAGIKYFGVDAYFVDEIAVSWAGYVYNNSLYVAGQDVEVDASTFSTEFENLLITEFASAEINRTEMFYVKDYIFADEESYAENIPQKDYVAYIFMPKTSVKISTISFVIHKQTENFKMFLNNNGNIKEFINNGFFYEEENNDSATSYEYQLNVDINVPIFTDLNINNAVDGVSLFNILHNSNAQYYLSKGEGNFYTFKDGALEVIFENGAPFYMAEYEVDYE